MNRSGFVLSLVIGLLLSSPVGADWLRFRGPNGSGISAESNSTPLSWGPKDVKWKVPLPGRGSSCPIVVADTIFVTCWSGYGLSRNDPGTQENLRRHLVCLDRRTGAELWTKTIQPFLPEDYYGGMFAEHGYASHTPVSDGQHVFVFFGKTGVLAFDLAGNELWRQSVGTESGAREWGSASSPILYKDFVIVPATAESEAIVALDKQSGKEVWRAEAAGFNSTWGSPILVKVNSERTDLVMSIPGELWGLDPDTGKLTWYAESMRADSICSSAVADQQGVIYAVEVGPRGGGGVAIKAGGRKDVTESHVIWSGRQNSRIATPLVHDGKLYLTSRGSMTCIDTATGEQVYRERLRSTRPAPPTETAPQRGFGGAGRRGGSRGGGQDYGSPIMADQKIYYTSRKGETFVVKVGTDFEQLSTNYVTTETEDFSATPAISDGELYIRSDKHLYCVAKVQ